MSPLTSHPVGLFWHIGEILERRPTGMSEQAFGHSGHTGQSIWIDPVRDVYIVVMTNRGHPRYEPTNTPLGKRSVEARIEIADQALRAIT
jgi:CubicO group peptidase (beta-lactamase class C family)